MADGGAGEAYYRTHADALSRDNALLRERVDKLEKANRLLMRSVYELSAALSAAALPAPALNILPDEDAALHDQPSDSPVPATAAKEDPKQVEAVAANRSTSTTPTAVGDAASTPSRVLFAEKGEWSGHRGAIYALAFAPSGKLLAAGGFDRAVRLWDTIKNEASSIIADAHSGPVSDVRWSADGNEVLSGGLDARVKLWDAAKSRISGQWELTSFVAQIALHSAEPHLFAACGGEKGVVLLFDRRAPVPARRMHDGEAAMGAVTFTRAGELVSGDCEGMLRLWDSKRDGQPLRRWSAAGDGGARGTSVTNICAGGTPSDTDDKYLLVNSHDHVVRLWKRGTDAADTTYKVAHSLQGVKGRHWPIRGSLQATKDARGVERWWAASGSADGAVLVWDLMSRGAPTAQRLSAHGVRSYAAVFHPTEPLLASSAADGVVKFFTTKPAAS